MKNTFIPKFTYVIAYKHQSDRIIPFKRVIEWISGFANIEIVIVEQDKNSKLVDLTFKGQHIFLESELPFNKAWAYNVAIKRTQSPILIFADADVIMNPNDLIESLGALESHDCVIPISNLIKLDLGETHQDLNTILKINRPGSKRSMTDGMSIFKRSAIERIGGWNEDIIGHGYVNKFQDMKIRRLLSYKEMNSNAYHFHHNPEVQQPSLSQRNQQIIEFYSKPDVDFQSHIGNTVPKSGNLNKYQL